MNESQSLRHQMMVHKIINSLSLGNITIVEAQVSLHELGYDFAEVWDMIQKHKAKPKVVNLR